MKNILFVISTVLIFTSCQVHQKDIMDELARELLGAMASKVSFELIDNTSGKDYFEFKAKEGY